MNQLYPMGFWNYVDMDHQGPADVADWADCGMTLTMTPEYDPAKDKKEDMIALLDTCHKQNIRMIVCDKRTRWTGASTDPEGYRARFATAMADFGSHPAVFGFHIGDEPHEKDAADCIAAFLIQQEMAPQLTPFLNHLPWHDYINECIESADFEQWLVDFVEKSNTPLLCYDCYSQMNPTDDGIDMYFRNLHIFSQAAKRTGIPWWTTLLSVGHFRYRCPSQDDLRWQISTAAASGAKGLLWFFFYERSQYINYRNSPIDLFGEKTRTYYDLRDCVRRFMRQHAPVLSTLELDRIYHVRKTYGGYPIFERRLDPLVVNITNDDRSPMILSVFKDKDGMEYCCVVNMSQTDNTYFTMTLRGDETKAYRYNSDGEGVLVVAQQDSGYQAGGGTIAISSWLAPGQMELYRIEK